MRLIQCAALVAVFAVSTGCKKGSDSAGKAAGNPACAGGTVDLTKLSGDWVAEGTISQPEGNYRGDQYRLRFSPPGADGKVSAKMAWRLDSRPFVGEITTNAFGSKLVLVEEMSDETVAQLKAAGNQDPNLPMRASIHLSPSEKGCRLDATDNFQTYLGEKVIEKTSPIGTLKLVPAAEGPVYSFVRCEVQRGITFDGKTDEGGRPIVLTADKPVAVKAVAARSAFPEDCDTFDADLFLDGRRVAENIAATLGEEDKVPAVIWESQLALPAGPLHGVELHAYANCGERKLVASACNLAYAQ